MSNNLKRLIGYIGGAVIAGTLLFAGQAQANYSFYRTITVTSTASIASGTNANFPMLVSSTLSSWKSSANGGKIQNLCTAANGGQEPCDLIFASSTACIPLDFETENYVSSTGAVIDWVNVPSLSTGTVIDVCYDNSSVNTDQSNTSGTWNSNFAGVWHLASPTSTLQGNDSTANANNGVNSNTTTTTGQIDGAGNFNGSTSHIDAGNNTSLKVANVTISAWVNAPSYPNTFNYIAGIEQTNSPYGWVIRVRPGGFGIDWTAANSTNLGEVWTTTNPSTNTWHQIVGTYDGTTMLIYLDGVSQPLNVGGTISGNLLSPAADFVIGDSYSYAPRPWNGAIDEVELSGIARSSQWILTEYSNEFSPDDSQGGSGFYHVGSETNVPSSGGSPIIQFLRRILTWDW